MKKIVHIVLITYSFILLWYLNSNAFGSSKKGHYIFTIGLFGYAIYACYLFVCKCLNELLKKAFILFLEEVKKITSTQEYYFIIEQIALESSCDFRISGLVNILEKILQDNDFKNKKQISEFIDIGNKNDILHRLKNNISEYYGKLSPIDILNKKVDCLLIDCVLINEHIKFVRSRKSILFSVLISLNILLIMVFKQSVAMLGVDIIMTVVIWMLFKKYFLNSFTYNIGYYFYIIINIGYTCIMPVYSIELFYSVSAVLLISVKMIVCMIMAMWPINNIYNYNAIENIKRTECLDEQLYLAMAYKIFRKLKTPIIWATLLLIIIMNIFVYTVITYNYVVGYGGIECLYNSALNYFTGNTIIPSVELVGQLEVIMLSQNIVAFVINTMFIANLLECVFSVKKDN